MHHGHTVFSFIDSVAEVNVSLDGTAYLTIYADIYDCYWFAMNLVIQRADGETERYTNTVMDSRRDYFEYYISDRELRFEGDCSFFCRMYISISPTDFQYDGAQISGEIHIPECFDTPNTTSPTTLNIQGKTIAQMVY